MDRFDEMRGKQGSGGGVNGILPMPISTFEARQKTPQENILTLSVNMPENANGVDVLIKGNEIPTSLNDYNQIVSIDSKIVDTEIEINPKSDGMFDNKYGLWLLSKNEVGRQTALSNLNTALIDFIFSKLAITVTSTQGHSSGLTKNIEIKDYVFMSSSTETYPGIYLLDKSSKTITKISSAGFLVNRVENLSDGYYLIVAGVSNSALLYIYNESTGVASALSNYMTNSGASTNSISTVINAGGEVFFGGATTGYYVWDKNAHTCTYHGGTGYSIIDTSSGVFIYANNKVIKRYNGNFADCTYQTINKENESGYNDPIAITTGTVVEDTFGQVYGNIDGYTTLYSGNNNFKQIEGSEKAYSAYTFKMGNYMYYIYQSKLYRYAETGIEYVCSTPSKSSSSVEALPFGEGWLLKSKNNSISADWEYDCYFANDNCQAISMPNIYGGTYALFEYITEDGSQRYYYSSSKSNSIWYIYIDENGLQQYTTVYSGDYVRDYQEVGNLIFSKGGNTSNKYIYVIDPINNTVTSIGSYKYYRSNTETTGIDCIKNDNLIYVVQYYPTPTTSYISNTIVYDITTGTATTTTEKKGGTRLSFGYYLNHTDKKIYCYEKGGEDITINLTTTNSNTTDICAGYVNTSGMTIIYMQ